MDEVTSLVPIILSLLTAFFVGIRYVIKFFTTESLEITLSSKENKAWNSFFQYFLIYLVFLFYLGAISLNKVSIISSMPSILIIIVLVAFFVSLLLVIIHSIIFTKRGFDYPRGKKMNRYLLVVGFVNLLTLLGLTSDFYSYDINSKEYLGASLGTSISNIIASLMIPVFLSYYCIYLFTKFHYIKVNKKKYKLVEDGKEYFVLNNIDNEFWLLGDEEEENKCSILFLFNKQTKQIIEFKPIS